MTEKQRKHLEERLLQERGRTMAALAKFDERFGGALHEDAGDLSLYPLHFADEGTDNIEQEKDMALASSEGRRLYDIDDALRKLYKEPESFGRCEACGGEIENERLEIVPWARYCLGCQQAREEGSGVAS